MNIKAKCAATMPTGDGLWVLLKFDPEPGHLLGQIPAELGRLEPDKTYRILIEEIGTLPA